MPDGMLKAAPPIQATPAPVHPQHQDITHVDGVPYELVKHFGLDIRRILEPDRQALNGIYDMLGGGNKMAGDILQDIRDIEIHLGSRMKKEGYHQVYTYLKLSRHIKDLEKQREALRP